MKRNHIQTDFIKFIFETYSKDGQRLPEEEEEIEIPDEENETPQLRIKKKLKKLNELEDDEIQDEEEPTEEEIDELVNEYNKRLKKKYENNRLPNRRKR